MFSLSILALMVTSCATRWDKYKKTTDYNLMQCQKMCSSGNVIQIEKFGCACNLNGKNSSNQNRNSNYSSSHGNVINMYPGQNRAPSQYEQVMGTMQQMQNYENQMLDRMSRELNPGVQSNTVVQPFKPMNWYGN